jgi:hypothetical protein
MKKILAAVLMWAGSAIIVDAQTIAQWTFEGGTGTLDPAIGTGTAILGTGGTQSFTAGVSSTGIGGSQYAWNSTGWDVGDYYQFSLSTTGYVDLTLSWYQTGSNTGPADFKLSYSTNGVDFVDFANYVVNVNGGGGNPAWSASNTTSDFSPYFYSFDLSGVSVIENQSVVYFRLVNTSTVSLNGGTVAAGGTNRVDNFTVVAVPEPTTATLVFGGFGSMLLVLRRRR